VAFDSLALLPEHALPPPRPPSLPPSPAPYPKAAQEERELVHGSARRGAQAADGEMGVQQLLEWGWGEQMDVQQLLEWGGGVP